MTMRCAWELKAGIEEWSRHAMDCSWPYNPTYPVPLSLFSIDLLANSGWEALLGLDEYEDNICKSTSKMANIILILCASLASFEINLLFLWLNVLISFTLPCRYTWSRMLLLLIEKEPMSNSDLMDLRKYLNVWRASRAAFYTFSVF